MRRGIPTDVLKITLDLMSEVPHNRPKAELVVKRLKSAAKASTNNEPLLALRQANFPRQFFKSDIAT